MRYQQNPRIAWRDVEGETVLIHPATGVVYVLNPIGAEIWRLLEEPQDQVAIDHSVSGRWAGTAAESRCAGDARAFVEALRERGLIEELS